MIYVLLNALLAVFNVVLYYAFDTPFSLFVAGLCSATALFRFLDELEART